MNGGIIIVLYEQTDELTDSLSTWYGNPDLYILYNNHSAGAYQYPNTTYYQWGSIPMVLI